MAQHDLLASNGCKVNCENMFHVNVVHARVVFMEPTGPRWLHPHLLCLSLKMLVKTSSSFAGTSSK